jgi:hypothetical protein
LSIRPAAGKILAFATTLVVLINAVSAPSACSAPEGPSAQIADRLQAPDQPSDESALVALYTTELHVTNVEEASEREWEMEGTIRRLPCALRKYRIIITKAAIDDSQASAQEAVIRIYSMRLPRGVRCGSALPPGATSGRADVKIEPVAEPTTSPTRYSGGRIVVESLSGCTTLEHLCPGRYVLMAYLASGDRQLRLTYAFAVVATSGAQDPVRTSTTAAVQCPAR